jgi:hypothetical protein
MRAVRFSILFLISATVEDVEVTEDLSQQVALQNVRTFPEGGAANAPEMRELPRPLAAPAIVFNFNIWDVPCRFKAARTDSQKRTAKH